MSEIFGFDAFSPKEIADRIDQLGVTKAKLPLLALFMLGLLAGAFIGLGALYYTLIISDSSLSYGFSRVLGGLAFSLGLILVIVAGAELFTGNNLLVMAWADGKIQFRELLRNWIIVLLANFIGASGLAVLVFLSGHPELQQGAIAQQYLKIASYKCQLTLPHAFFSGILCNVLVCLAVWMAQAGRSVMDRVIVIIFPISAFVACGFEHSIANMYFIPMAWLLQQSQGIAPGSFIVNSGTMFHNLLPVILGNICGGSLLVASVYYLIYRKGMGSKKPAQN